MAVEILWLRGRSSAEAQEDAERLIDLRTGPLDLSRLLVIDDTSLLADHAAVFRRLSSGRRVEKLLCVATGPRPENTPRPPMLPDSLAGPHGPGVLWVGDPDGIEWRVAPGTRIKGRKRGPQDGLTRLVQLLLVEAVFNEVWQTFEHRVPHRVASPGLRLVGADDETATFKAALALAIEGITASGSGDDGPFRSLLPVPDAVVLKQDGPLAGYRARVADAVAAAEAAAAKGTGGLRLFRRADGGIDEHLRTAGTALGQLRELVIRLLQAANSTGGLTDNQRAALLDAGLEFPAAPHPGSPAAPDEPAQSPGFQAISSALDGGDTLPFIQRRLTATTKEIKRYGSAAYLPQVETACPASLPASLAEVGVDAADQAAAGLIALVQGVASREWSPAAAEPDELDRARIAITGIHSALLAYAAEAPQVRAARLVRLSEHLLPVLRALVRQVLQDEYGAPGAVGQDTLDAAHERTGGHLTDWTDLVQVDGVTSRPKFAPPGTTQAMYTVESDLSAIRDALLADPKGEMWQLCGQDDVTALNVGQEPLAVRFAPRQHERELADVVPRGTVWLSSGEQAGLLRLVPLHHEIVTGDLLPEDPNPADPE